MQSMDVIMQNVNDVSRDTEKMHAIGSNCFFHCYLEKRNVSPSIF